MWKWIKVPKGIALLAFALPWLTVSCGAQKFVTASGYNLATGTTRVVNPMTSAVETHGGTINAWLLIALILVVGGLAATFLAKRAGALIVLATSVAAFVLTWIGTASIESSFAREVTKAAAKSSPGGAPSPFGAPDMSKMAALIRFEWELGYWLCMLALLVSAIMAWLVFTGRDATALNRARGAMGSAREPLAADPVAAAVTCPTCGRQFPASTHFCPEDGTALS